jgi:hypothetical protein
VTAVVVLKPGHTGDAAMTEALQNHVKADHRALQISAAPCSTATPCRRPPPASCNASCCARNSPASRRSLRSLGEECRLRDRPAAPIMPSQPSSQPHPSLEPSHDRADPRHAGNHSCSPPSSWRAMTGPPRPSPSARCSRHCALLVSEHEMPHELLLGNYVWFYSYNMQNGGSRSSSTTADGTRCSRGARRGWAAEHWCQPASGLASQRRGSGR